MLAIVLALLGFVCLVLFFLKKSPVAVTEARPDGPKIEQSPLLEVGEDFGSMQVFYASQTGTAAKMASSFAEEAEEKGFKPVVIDLKDFNSSVFKVSSLPFRPMRSRSSSCQTREKERPPTTQSIS